MSERAGYAKKNESKKTRGKKTDSRKTKPNNSQLQDSPAGKIRDLQQNIGNSAVQSLLQSGEIQAKLTVGPVDDSFEQEADRFADRVMTMTGEGADFVQRIPGEMEYPEEKPVQAKRLSLQTPEVTPDVESGINSLNGGGQPLSESTRSFFEPRFGVDFSHVRVNTGETAAQAAQSIKAKAFTTGNNIVFNSNRYAPDSKEGKHLLAHELAHVVQQRGMTGLGIQMSKLSEHKGSNPYDISNSDIKETEEYKAYRNPELIWQTELQMTIEQSLLACRLMLNEMNTREEGEVIDWEQEARGFADSAITHTTRPFIGPILLPEFVLPAPARVAGEPAPNPDYKIIRIAWTLDDGPTAYTEEMQEVLASPGESETGARPGTWFIMRNALGEGSVLQQNLETFSQQQDQAPNLTEFAIHSFHKTEGHAAWFPAGVDDAPKAYDTIEAAMQDLTDFVNVLRGATLTVNFVRLPGGLVSELTWYLRDHAGIIDEESREEKARAIINGTLAEDADDKVKEVQEDYKTMQKTVSSLGLYLWGGSGKGSSVTSNQSWEAESSGSGLTDNITSKFEGLVNEFDAKQYPRSLVVLAHDTNEDNVAEVGRDILTMENLAKEKGVKIEYYTMTNLFRVLREEEP